MTFKGPRQPPTLTAGSEYERDSQSDLLADWKQYPVVGLENLGNTCFMNCTLQQLLHVQPLVSYFLQDDIGKKVNKRSCRDGVLCASFATLCRDVIKAANSSTKSIAPVKFKKAVAQYAPYLLDYQQQDCHEFMRFLLDGLSEDLCRSALPERKPPTSSPAETESEDNSPAKLTAMSPAKASLSERLRERVAGARMTFADPPALVSNKSAPSAIGKTGSPAASFKGRNPFSLSGKTEVDSDVDTVGMAEVRIDDDEGTDANDMGTTDSSCTVSAATTAETTDAQDPSEASRVQAGMAAAPLDTSLDEDQKKEKEKEKEPALSAQQAAFKAWQSYLRLNDSVVTDLFAGMLQSTLECQTCKNITHSFEPFLDLSVSIPRAESKSLLQKTLRATGAGGGQGSQVSLDSCLQQYTARERLDDMFDCEKCKQKRKVVKRMSIFKCPKILVVHVKRFYFKDMMHREKITSEVAFQSEGLDLSPYLAETIYGQGNSAVVPPTSGSGQNPTPVGMALPSLAPSTAGGVTYDLLSMSNHAGSGMNGGHYYAHVDVNRWTRSGKGQEASGMEAGDANGGFSGPEVGGPASTTAHKEKWVVCDDERIKRVKKVEGRLGGSAYILFYQLRE